MKSSFCLLAIAGLSVLMPVSAQDQQTNEYHNLKIAIEFGTNVIGTKLAKPEQIRENYSADDKNNYGLFADREYTSMKTKYFGLKPEFFVFHNRVGIASGLRLTVVNAELASNSGNNVFLWKIKEDKNDDLITDYVRIMDIHQKSHLLSVPFELRFFLNNREKPVQNYIKLGASINYNISSKYNVNFTDKAMEKHNDLINGQLSGYNMLSAFFFGAFGFKIGKYREGSWVPWGNIEFQFPYILLTDKSFAFAGKYNKIENFPGAGLQISFQIPIGNNVPIGSN